MSVEKSEFDEKLNIIIEGEIKGEIKIDYADKK